MKYVMKSLNRKSLSPAHTFLRYHRWALMWIFIKYLSFCLLLSLTFHKDSITFYTDLFSALKCFYHSGNWYIRQLILRGSLRADVILTQGWTTDPKNNSFDIWLLPEPQIDFIFVICTAIKPVIISFAQKQQTSWESSWVLMRSSSSSPETSRWETAGKDV